MTSPPRPAPRPVPGSLPLGAGPAEAPHGADLSAEAFFALIDRVPHDPSADAELHARFGRTVVTLVLDFTAMVRRTDAQGIGMALAVARAATRAVLPELLDRGAQPIKSVADTLFCTFPTPVQALEAAFAASRAAAAFNAARAPGADPDSVHHIHPCVGLGYGPALVIPGVDLYGAETNRAFVLGEDVAGAHEVLCTAAFLQALGPLPDGVGAFTAPAARAAEAGFPFSVLRDYRG